MGKTTHMITLIEDQLRVTIEKVGLHTVIVALSNACVYGDAMSDEDWSLSDGDGKALKRLFSYYDDIKSLVK